MIFLAHLRVIGNFLISALFEHLPQYVKDMLAATTETLKAQTKAEYKVLV